MYILGISIFTHDTAAALFLEGELLCFFEEERLNRKKHTTDFPILAIKECLKFARIEFSQISKVAISQRPWDEVLGNLMHFIKFFPSTLNLFHSEKNSLEKHSLSQKWIESINLKNTFHTEFKIEKSPEVIFCSHHLCHNASAFFASPFEDSALLSLDGRGESVTTQFAYGSDGKIQVLDEIKVPHSLGHLYAAITSYLGFAPFADEWKVMGLSAYGSDRFVKKFDNIVLLDSNRNFTLDLSYFRFHTHGRNIWFSDKFESEFGSKRAGNEEILQHHKDVAYATQKAVENCGLHLALQLKKKTPSSNLCLSGGVALNCLMNSKILKESGFRNVFVQPVANDAGAAIGAGWLVAARTQKVHRNKFSIYLGGEFSDLEILEELKNFEATHNLNIEIPPNILEVTAKHLFENKVVAWFQGRMEAGPRALGNRSLLANPGNSAIKDRINLIIKKREYFRPFAPCVLREHAAEFFDVGSDQDFSHMTYVFKVREDKQKMIPAVTHYDGTSRVQTVNPDENPIFYNLLTKFYEISGVPVLLNTSFNENEPIVYKPKEAIECFLRTGVDFLVIGKFIVSKKL